LQKEQPSAKISSAITDTYPLRPEKISITSSFSYISARLGSGAPKSEAMRSTLSALGLKVVGSGDTFEAAVPYHRATRDLSHADDLVEEVGRCHGYENINEAPPLLASTPCPLPAMRDLEHECRDSLRGAGFKEVSNYSFVDPGYASEIGYQMSEAIRIENPMDANQGAMRTSLVPGMLKVLSSNSRFESSFRVFEIGRSYHPAPDPRFSTYKTHINLPNLAVFERRLLCLASLEVRPGFNPIGLEAGSEFFTMLSEVRKLVSLRTGQKLRVEPVAVGSALKWMHPYRAANVFAADYFLGVVSEVISNEEWQGRAVLAELELDTLLELSTRRSYEPASKFPTSLFEMSIVCPTRTPFSSLEKVLAENSPLELLRSLEVLAVYEGKPLTEGHKSVSVRLEFGTNDRTLPPEEITTIQEALMKGVEKSGYALRR
jgi:phenylalanyl-tRNA synthetase beta chain